MRYAVLADLHGRPKALRWVLAAAAQADVDEVVCLGDYLEAKVPRRLHDPSRSWPLESVIDPDPPLWARLAGIRRVLGNQEERIRELLQSDQVPPGLAPLLEAPGWARLHTVVGLHGHQIRWSADATGTAGVAGRLLLPEPDDVPRVSVVLAGHSHQSAVFEIRRAGSGGPAASAGPAVRVLPVEPGRPLPLPPVSGTAILGDPSGWAPGLVGQPPAEAGCDTTLLINIGPARSHPYTWLLYDTDRHDVTFSKVHRPTKKNG